MIDLATRTLRPLSKFRGKRVRHPAISVDDQRITFVSNESGFDEIAFDALGTTTLTGVGVSRLRRAPAAKHRVASRRSGTQNACSVARFCIASNMNRQAVGTHADQRLCTPGPGPWLIWPPDG